MTPDAIAQALTTQRLGRPALVYERTGSTNDVAHEQARAGAKDGLLLLAEEQTAGRGRLDRSWWAPAGTCLLMTLLLRPALPLARAGQLTMCLGLGAVEGIEEVTGVDARLKWPNDLLVNGRKLGGMLAELSSEDGRLDYAVLGLGLNVNVDFARDGAPPEVSALATSLLLETGREVDRVALLAAILARTEQWYGGALAGKSPHEAWAARLDTLGRRVRVAMTVGAAVEGVAVGVTPEGALLVREDSGAVRTVWSGDAQAVR
jgi:BirA family transcriptional regulator, biotin operon repressor / biotin---[acetyl-CoA-carboxylase] ligase